MNPHDQRARSLRRVAWLCAALVLAITSLSAFIRLSRAGLDCEPWPQCYGEALRSAQQGVPHSAEPPVAVTAARFAHRFVAVAALVAIVFLLKAAYFTRPVLRRESRLALALLVLAIFLALLGRWSADARVPAVTLGNLLAGFSMLAIGVRLARSTRVAGLFAPRTPAWLASWAWAALAMVALTVALGGVVNAGYASLSCQPALWGCDLAHSSWQALNPWHEPLLAAATPTNPSGALALVAHRVAAVITVLVTLPLGVAAWRAGVRTGGAVLALLAAQVALGAVLTLAPLHLWAALAHNIVAALLLAALLEIAAGRPAAS
jgi:cytochrome c oxidase assembly protein subunit 15